MTVDRGVLKGLVGEYSARNRVVEGSNPSLAIWDCRITVFRLLEAQKIGVQLSSVPFSLENKHG